MYVNIFDAATEEWLWKTNPKVTHIHERCVELWGPKDEVEKEEELEEEELEEESSEDESEPEAEPDEEEESNEDESEPEAEPEVESPKEETPGEVESSEEEPEEESNSSVFAAARQAAANRKAASKKVEKPSKPSTKKKVEKPSKKVESIEEESEVDKAGEETTEKSGFLIWVLSIIAIAITAISIYLAFKPGKELETLGLTAQYVEATNRLNKEVEPAWYRWESWDRQVAAEATLVWGPYFRSLYVTGEGANPTPNSVQLYAVYLTLKVLVQQGHEPGEALRIIREEGSKSVVSALNKGNISKEDIRFIREYMMK